MQFRDASPFVGTQRCGQHLGNHAGAGVSFDQPVGRGKTTSRSLPARLALAVNAKNVPETTDAVIVAAATQMMLADVPADTAADTIGVVLSHVAEVLLAAPKQ